MTVARVVPLRRLPVDRPWFDYLVPDAGKVSVGQLVEVPFGRQTIPGVIWEIVAESSITNLKPIGAVVRPDPVMTDWQRLAWTKLSAWYFVSLGHLVASAIPAYPKRAAAPDELMIENPPLRTAQAMTERLWWYRNRQDVISNIGSWLLKDEALRVVCVPTVDDLNEVVDALGSDGRLVARVHGQLGERDYRLLYERIRRGQVRKIVGTGRVFHLPYPREPKFLLDQEEHPAHRQAEQHPRYDNRQTIECLAANAILTSPSPSIVTMIRRHPPVPSFTGSRRLVSLDQPGAHDWVSPEAETLMNETLHRGHSPLLIVPHHGFAQRVACRDCGWTLTCSTCDRRVRLKKDHRGTITCLACSATVHVPETCPRCRSVHWSVSGLGIERMAETVKRRWPQVAIQLADDSTTHHPAIWIGTYQDHRRRRAETGLGSIILVSGDALLSYPDFAVNERAWAYLARLQADRPDEEVMVQTYEPEAVFWQRWRHGDDRHWYDDEIKQRTSLALPPLAEHWIVHLPNGQPETLAAKQREVTRLLPPGVTITILPAATTRRWRRSPGRLLLQPPVGLDLRAALDWAALFPTPWQIDPAIRGWAE